MTRAVSIQNGFCVTCEREIMDNEIVGIQYDPLTSRNAYDGVSEWMHMVCGRREGRWTGRELAEGEEEERYGGRRASTRWGDDLPPFSLHNDPEAAV